MRTNLKSIFEFNLILIYLLFIILKLILTYLLRRGKFIFKKLYL